MKRSDFTVDQLKESIQDFYDRSPEPARDFVVMTGQGGMEMINRQIQITVAEEELVYLLKLKMVTKEEAINISAMIHSPDRENFVVAQSIMTQLRKKI